MTETMHKIGGFYRRTMTKETYILAEVDYCKFALINLEGGNRWRDAIEATYVDGPEDPFTAISDEDFNEISKGIDGHPAFEKLPEDEIITVEVPEW